MAEIGIAHKRKLVWYWSYLAAYLHVGQFGLVISVKCCATSLATADDSSLEILVLAKLES